jgi:hypothetical protein
LDELERLHAAVAPWLEAPRQQGRVTKAEVDLTIDDAVSFLHPPITRQQLAGLIATLSIQPIGKRWRPTRGRPALTYDASELMELHAAVVPWL